MTGLIKWLRDHVFETHLIALLLMALPPAAMVFAARSGATGLVWALLGLVVLGNLLVLSVR
jgi:hypothetical protein